MNQIEKQNELSAFIQGLDHVREVNQSEEAAKTLGSFNRLVSYASMAIIAVLLLISVFLISNTVSVGISVRKEEIGIMKYIGATDGFVRAPFVMEGMVLGIVGAAIPLVALYFLYNTAVRICTDKIQCSDRCGCVYSGNRHLYDASSYWPCTGNRNWSDRKLPDNEKTSSCIRKRIQEYSVYIKSPDSIRK